MLKEKETLSLAPQSVKNKICPLLEGVPKEKEPLSLAPTTKMGPLLEGVPKEKKALAPENAKISLKVEG